MYKREIVDPFATPEHLDLRSKQSPFESRSSVSFHLADGASLALNSLHDSSNSRVSSKRSGVDVGSALTVVGSRLDPRVLRVKVPQGHASA